MKNFTHVFLIGDLNLTIFVNVLEEAQREDHLNTVHNQLQIFIPASSEYIKVFGIQVYPKALTIKPTFCYCAQQLQGELLPKQAV